MKKISAIISGLIVVFAVVYPFLVQDEYDWGYAFTMALIIGAGTIVENLFGIKCKILLQSDQKYYVQIVITMITNIFVSVVSIILILSDCSLRIVKIAAVIVAFIDPLLLNLYVKHNYKIDWTAKPDYKAISQRWDAFFQQVAVVINENVDLVVLTAFVALREVSVYTVHAMIAFNMGKIVNSCVTGINSTFGDLYARKEYSGLKKLFKFSEWKVFAVGAILYSVTAIMIDSFVSIYTNSIVDVDYYRPVFSLLMVSVVFLGTIRIPYQMLAEGAGKFKETRNGAVVEAVLNVIISVVFVWKFGIVGVLLGTLISSIIRTIEYAVFCYKNILTINVFDILKHYLIVLFTYVGIVFLGKLLVEFFVIDNYFTWAISASVVFVAVSLIVGLVSVLFYRKQTESVFVKLRRKK